MRRLSFTDHVALSKLFHPILRFNTTNYAYPSRGKTTLFLPRSEVDGFFLFRSISRSATWQTPMSWRMSIPRQEPIGADPGHTANEYHHATSEYCDHSRCVSALVRIHTLPCRSSLVRGHRMKAARNSATGVKQFESSSCGVEMFAGGEARLPYLHGKPLPGRRHPVEAASRRSRARDQRLPNDAGPTPSRWGHGSPS